jgi:hypothetical protein
VANTVLEFVIRAKDEISRVLTNASKSLKTFGSQGASVKTGIDWAAHAAGGMADQAGDLAKKQAEANRAMMAAMQAGMGLRNVMAGGTTAIGGAAQMVRALTKELKILATTDIKNLGLGALGPLIGAAVAGFKAGQLLDDAFNISDKVSGWIVKPIQFAVARSYQSFNELDNIKLNGLKKEIDSISEGLEKVVAKSERALSRNLSLLGAGKEQQMEAAQAISDPTERAARVAQVEKQYNDQELTLRRTANQEQMAETSKAQSSVGARLESLLSQKARLEAAESLAKQQFAIDQQKGTLTPDSPSLIRLKETRAEAESFRQTFSPEIERLTKVKNELDESVADLANAANVISTEQATTEQKFKNAMAAADPEAAIRKAAFGEDEAGEFAKMQDELREFAAKQKEEGIKKQLVAAEANADFMRPAIGAAEDRIAKAEAQVDQAWGWVKDPQSFRQQLKSEKENAKAQQKFEKDAERLQQQADWRTKRLGAKDEATRRMILAQEEKDKADAALNDIRKHVANLDQIKDDLKKALNAAGG